MSGCERGRVFVIVVGSSGMWVGHCRLSLMVVVGGVVNLPDVVVVVEERSNVTRCNVVDIHMQDHMQIFSRESYSRFCLQLTFVVSCLAMF
jgi:hypothetical protein